MAHSDRGQPDCTKDEGVKSYDHKLNKTQGVAGNLGMYGMGIPAGLLIDRRGPKYGIAIGTIALAFGYFPLHSAYGQGPGGSIGFYLSCLCCFFTGTGSCTAFTAAIKTATFNWPEHRGTATAFPLSAFGLSAFVFASIGTLAFGDNIADLLLLLSIGTLCFNLLGLPFIRLISAGQEYDVLPSDEDRADVRPAVKARSRASTMSTVRPGERHPSPHPSQPVNSATNGSSDARANLTTTATTESRLVVDEEQGLARSRVASPSLSSNSVSSEEGQGLRLSRSVSRQSAPRPTSAGGRSSHDYGLEITGFKLLERLEFWQLFVMLALLAGVGLMTINNIGNNVKALIRHWIPTATPTYYRSSEAFHVSLLSLFSFVGRFLSGVGSDFLVKRLQASRFWCLTVSGGVFTLAQMFAIGTRNPHLLPIVTVLTGIAYGALFGVYPALIADTFGVSGLSLNWGYIIFAPVVSGFIFNRYYGWVYDDHSHIINDGTLDCPDGLDCYQMAYFITCGSSMAAVALSLWCISLQNQRAKGRTRALSRSVRYGE
ncbi:MAG: hypothetical protein Q9162_002638 [Coniocarpon cinnabarinum]